MRRAFEVKPGELWRGDPIRETALVNDGAAILMLLESGGSIMVPFAEPEPLEFIAHRPPLTAEQHLAAAAAEEPRIPSEEMQAHQRSREIPVIAMGAGHQEAGI